LDRYSADWVATSTDSCLATRVRREQTEDILSLQQTCLDQRLHALRAVTRRLASANRELVDNSAAVVAELEPVSWCADIVALVTRGVPPSEPRDKVRELEAVFAEMNAQAAAGHHAETVATSVRALELAGELRFLPWKTQTLMYRGGALAVVGRIDEAIAALRDAVWTGVEGRAEPLAATAAATIATLLESQHKVAEAQIWVDLAKALVASSGHEPPIELPVLRAEIAIAGSRGDMTAATAQQPALLAHGHQDC